jgi:hypothetical protein
MTQIRTDQVPSKLAELVDEIKVVFAPPRTVIRRRPGLLKQRCFAGSTASIRRTVMRVRRRQFLYGLRVAGTSRRSAFMQLALMCGGLALATLGCGFLSLVFNGEGSTDPAGNRDLASEFLMTGLERTAASTAIYRTWARLPTYNGCRASYRCRG